MSSLSHCISVRSVPFWTNAFLTCPQHYSGFFYPFTLSNFVCRQFLCHFIGKIIVFSITRSFLHQFSRYNMYVIRKIIPTFDIFLQILSCNRASPSHVLLIRTYLLSFVLTHFQSLICITWKTFKIHQALYFKKRGNNDILSAFLILFLNSDIFLSYLTIVLLI